MLLLYTSEDISEKMKANRLGGVKSFLGLLIIGGAIKGRYRSFHLYTLSVTAYLYIATMSMERFLLLKRFLRFDDRRHHDPTDPHSPVRDMWKIFNEKPSQYYTL